VHTDFNLFSLLEQEIMMHKSKIMTSTSPVFCNRPT